MTQTEEAAKKLLELFRAGLRHGFFKFEIRCELVNSRKRNVIIQAGNSYQFIIPESEID